MADEIIHFAGPVCTFGSISRQRCQWCGALIQERDLAAIAMLEDDREPERRGKPIEVEEIGWWSGLVAVSGTNPVVLLAVDELDDQQAPERSCMVVLPEEVGRRDA